MPSASMSSTPLEPEGDDALHLGVLVLSSASVTTSMSCGRTCCRQPVDLADEAHHELVGGVS